MATVTFYNPTPTLPAIITEPPTAQFTPGPGCVDPEDHWAVVTSCFAIALEDNYETYSSPDWLTCQVTEFGPPPGMPSCTIPYEAGTVVDEVTTYYSGCPSAYTAASTYAYSYKEGGEEGAERIEVAYCCPTQYDFSVYEGNGVESTTERDGVTWSVIYPLPGCAASYVKELSGKDLAVQTAFNTYAWEKRQLANVPWDYSHDTLFAELVYQSYTVFHSTHTCYEFENCFSWHSYYFSGGPMPSFTVPDNVPAMTTSVDDPAPTSSGSEVETPTPEETTPVEEPSSSIEQTSVPSTPSEDGQTTVTPTGEDSIPSPSSSVDSTPTSTPIASGSSNSSQSPSATTSTVPEGAAGVLTPNRLVAFGFLLSLLAL
ncbi:hypothetical protein F5Y08DRAFT_322100 [Xylaria arbuscula]|nr:hypothetical protein F5Y08DRAFT_322100 [Xylaria arbuscula]